MGRRQRRNTFSSLREGCSVPRKASWLDFLKQSLPGYRHCGLLARGSLGLVNAGVYVGGKKKKETRATRGGAGEDRDREEAVTRLHKHRE